MLRVLSLGSGVQSTTVALMALAGEIERPDCAIFADTGWEPKAVYVHLDWLEGVLGSAIPVHRVTAGNIRDVTLRRATGDEGVGATKHMAAMPFHVMGLDERPALLRRQCTQEFKIEPIRRKIRDLLGRSPTPGCVEQWFGISFDEVHRMRQPDVRYIVNRYPLVDARMTRQDCLLWLERHGYHRPPKSACIGCPYHGDAQWRAMKLDRPEEFADAAAFDRGIRRLPRVRGDAFLHRSLKPLDEVDLRNDRDRGQLDLFDEECEGLCGV